MTVPGEKGGLQHMNHDLPSSPNTICLCGGTEKKTLSEVLAAAGGALNDP